MISEHINAPQTQPTVPWGWQSIGLVFLAIAAGTAAMMVALRLTVQLTGMNVEAGLSSPLPYAAATGFCGLILLSVYIFAARRAGWAALGFRAAPWQTIAATPLLLVAGLLIVGLVNTAMMALTGGTFENPQVEALTGGNPIEPPVFILLLVLIAGLVPVAEEVLFRGMIYPVLRRHWHPAVAIVVNAAIFAAVHFIPLLFPALFVVGVMLALLREWSDSIIPCIVYHALQNTLALIAISAMLSGAIQ